MNHDLIVSILQKSYCLKNEQYTGEAKEFINKLKNSNNLLLNPLVVHKLADILSEILRKCIELSATSTEAQLETQIVDSLHSWCQLSDIPNHEIYTTETLKVLLDELTNQFPEINLNFNDLSLFRECKKHDLPDKCDNIESIYTKKLEYRQKVQLRNKVQFEINKNYEQNPFIQSKMLNEIHNPLLSVINKKEQVVKNSAENVDVKKIMTLIAALKNLNRNSEISIKFKIEQLLKNITNSLFIHISDINNLESYNHIFYEEHYNPQLNSTNNNQELLYLENASTSLIERIILEEVLQAILKIQLQNIGYTYSELIILINNFDLNNCSKLKKIFNFCNISQKLFITITSILNELLIKVNFDLRVIIIVRSLLKEITSHKRIGLYPKKYRDLVFHLDLYPETLHALNMDNHILEKLFELYLESPRICLMLLSHYPAWIAHFSEFFNNLCQ